jgi:hypothetical protein
VPKNQFLRIWGLCGIGSPAISRLTTEDSAMQDATMLFFTAVFFGLAVLYVKACQRLR